MALITCKNCGRNVSDTRETCVHCGASLRDESQIQQENPSVCGEQEQIETPAELQSCERAAASDTETTLGEETRVFAYLTASEKKQLEDEFLENDKWARNYLRQKTEFKKFRRTFYWFLVGIVAVIVIVRSVAMEQARLLEYYIVDESLIEAAAISLVALAALCLGMFLYGMIGPIYVSITHKKYKYSKKFMLWLEKEKRVKYSPPLTFEREKKIFDNIKV